MMGWAWMGPTRPHRSPKVSLEGAVRTQPHKAHKVPRSVICVQFCHLLRVNFRKAHALTKSH